MYLMEKLERMIKHDTRFSIVRRIIDGPTGHLVLLAHEATKIEELQKILNTLPIEDLRPRRIPFDQDEHGIWIGHLLFRDAESVVAVWVYPSEEMCCQAPTHMFWNEWTCCLVELN